MVWLGQRDPPTLLSLRPCSHLHGGMACKGIGEDPNEATQGSGIWRELRSCCDGSQRQVERGVTLEVVMGESGAQSQVVVEVSLVRDLVP